MCVYDIVFNLFLNVSVLFSLWYGQRYSSLLFVMRYFFCSSCVIFALVLNDSVRFLSLRSVCYLRLSPGCITSFSSISYVACYRNRTLTFPNRIYFFFSYSLCFLPPSTLSSSLSMNRETIKQIVSVFVSHSFSGTS